MNTFLSGSRGKYLLQMCAVIGDIFFYLRVFDNVVANERRQPRRAEKFVGFVEVQIDAVHARAFKEIACAGECFYRCVPGG